MNEQLSELLKIVASYIMVLFIGYFLINFLSNGFLNKFIAVKISRGKKTLVEIKDVGGVYYRTGKITDGVLFYKNNKNEKKMLNVNNQDIEYRMGMKTISTDAVKNSIIRSDGSQVEGHDAIKNDNLYVRCLTSPKLQDQLLKIILLIIIVVALISLANVFLAVKTQQAIAGLQSMVTSTATI